MQTKTSTFQYLGWNAWRFPASGTHTWSGMVSFCWAPLPCYWRRSNLNMHQPPERSRKIHELRQVWDWLTSLGLSQEPFCCKGSPYGHKFVKSQTILNSTSPENTSRSQATSFMVVSCVSWGRWMVSRGCNQCRSRLLTHDSYADVMFDECFVWFSGLEETRRAAFALLETWGRTARFHQGQGVQNVWCGERHRTISCLYILYNHLV